MNFPKKKVANENQAFVYKIIKFTFGFSIVFSLIVYYVSLKLSSIPIDDALRGYFVGSAETWIIYSGTVLGGLLTMFGVAYSILYNLKQRQLNEEENKKIELTKNRPYIYVESFTTTYSLGNILVTDIVVKNISSNPVREFTVNNENSYVIINELNYKRNNNFTLNEKQLILANESSKMQLVIQFPDLIDEGDYRFETSLIFTYKDITGENQFSHGVSSIGEINLLIDDKGSFDIRQSKNISLNNEYYWYK